MSRQSSHDYMQQWLDLDLRRRFLGRILKQEAPAGELCSKCKERPFKIRCNDCLYNPLLCIQCCRDMHQEHVFHRIEAWTDGTHFTPSWLWQTGVSIHLGHGGNHCPSNEDMVAPDGETLLHPQSTSFNYTQGQPEMEEEDSDTEDQMPEYGWSGSAAPPHGYAPGAQEVVVVHTNAVHRLPVFLCSCPDAPDPMDQYLEMGFYPATFKEIETLFTFQVLDDYLLQNLECQTSCHHYYSKLRRMTNKIFPGSVPVSLA